MKIRGKYMNSESLRLRVMILGIILLTYIDVGKSADWWYPGDTLRRVSQTHCGSAISITSKPIILRYDGASLDGKCVVHINIYNPVNRYAILCIKLNTAQTSYDCDSSFRFYFGKYPDNTSQNSYSCQEIGHRTVCDYGYHDTAHAEFTTSLVSFFEIELSTKSGFPTTKRPTDWSDSSESSWTSWSSYSYSSEEFNKEAVTGVVIGSGFIVLLVVIIVVIRWYLKRNSQHVRTYQPRRNRENEERPNLSSGPPEYGTVVTETHSDGATETSSANAPPVTPSVQVQSNPSAVEEPPPSYTSLFGTS